MQDRRAKGANRELIGKSKKIYFRASGEVEDEITPPNQHNKIDTLALNSTEDSATSTSSHNYFQTSNIKVMTREALRCPENVKREASVAKNFNANKLQDDNIGFKMLQNLGWRGGSLGKNCDGIAEPVRVNIKRNRHCIGLHQSDQANHYGYQDLFVFLRTYKNDRNSNYEMEFKDEFSDKEKKLLNAVCRRLKLNSRKIEHGEVGLYTLRIWKAYD